MERPEAAADRGPARALSAVSARDALDGAVTALGAAGCETARLDAEVLLADALEIDRLALLTDLERPVQGEAVRAFQNAVRRRSVDREPVAYIVGRRAFRHLELAVDPRVLIPRPETELLVEVGLELPAGTRVHDLGTGSGAVALALKQERPDLEVTGSDRSPEALTVARANGERLGLEVRFSVGRFRDLALAWDALLCNPPYVADSEWTTLAPEVRHEPAEALLAGADGLDGVREVVEIVREKTLAASAFLVALEVGDGQAPAVRAMLRDAGAQRVAVRPDLAGIDRVVMAWRP
jgi:release factor glutamine methyltransferase